jgi:hypothetical protein
MRGGLSQRVPFPGQAVDASSESAYARGTFDMFEASSAGIALARADRTFAVCDSALCANPAAGGHEGD